MGKKKEDMKASKEQVEKAILFFAKTFGQEENYKALMSSYPGTPKIVEMIVYEMFLQKFNAYYCTDEQYDQYMLIHEYSTELKQIGWVTHNKEKESEDQKRKNSEKYHQDLTLLFNKLESLLNRLENKNQ